LLRLTDLIAASHDSALPLSPFSAKSRQRVEPQMDTDFHGFLNLLIRVSSVSIRG
jgi:hypothetical protein